MKQLQFLCLDDDDAVRSLVNTLNHASNLYKVEYKPPQEFGTQVAEIVALAKKHEIDGVIIDLRLDQLTAPGQQTRAKYRASSLAQELRTLATEGKIPAFPLFLWSIDPKLKQSFNRDGTSHDLFDLVLLKNEFPSSAKAIAPRLVSVAKAYQAIAISVNKAKQYCDLLGGEGNSDDIDPRIGDQFAKAIKAYPVHVHAHYILSEIVERPGPLVDKPLVLARLGVELSRSPDIETVFKHLDNVARYDGPFSEGWERWWWHRVDSWWKSITSGSLSMTSIPAAARVELLKKALKLKGLVPATPISKEYGVYFTTICQVLKRPLDPMDGFVLACANKRPWQDQQYVSREAALNPARFEIKVELDSLEKRRLESFR